MAKKKTVKKRVDAEASIGDLFAYLVKNTYRLRAIENVSRQCGSTHGDSWSFLYGTAMHVLCDAEILAELGERTEADDMPYGR